MDDSLIAERKSGLTAYLTSLIASPTYITSPALITFLARAPSREPSSAFNPEDALPSTFTRAAALKVQDRLVTTASTPIAAAYYPWWSAWARTPESLDFSKFDILFYGTPTSPLPRFSLIDYSCFSVRHP